MEYTRYGISTYGYQIVLSSDLLKDMFFPFTSLDKFGKKWVAYRISAISVCSISAMKLKLMAFVLKLSWQECTGNLNYADDFMGV